MTERLAIDSKCVPVPSSIRHDQMVAPPDVSLAAGEVVINALCGM
jgi:hypothetical protein